MKGPRELKRIVATCRKRLKAIHWDDLWVMRLQNAKNNRAWKERNAPRPDHRDDNR